MILIGFLVSIQFVSCTSREKREIKQMMGRTVRLGGNFIYIDSACVSTKSQYNNEIRVMTILDNNDCYECMFKPILGIELLLSKSNVNADDAEILAFVDSIDIQKAQLVLKSMNLDATIVVDSLNYYKQKNNVNELLYKNRTFIVDSKNRIVFVGNPLISPSLSPLFVNTLNNLIKNKGVYK